MGKRAKDNAPQQKAAAIAAHTLDFAELERRLTLLPADQRRAAQSLLGLAIGDGAGLPFEFNSYNRGEADELWHSRRTGAVGELDLTKDLLSDEISQIVIYYGHCVGAIEKYDLDGDSLARLDSLIHRKILERTSRKATGTPFCRGYSDDTACADIKMQAVARMAFRSDGCTQPEFARCLVTEYLHWAWGRGGGKSNLFQGRGPFTADWLKPNKSLFRGQMFVRGSDRQPSNEYLEFSERFLAGNLPDTFPSWGNGAVMSLAPQAILETGEGKEGVPSDLIAMSAVLSNTHQHSSAQAGARLLAELLGLLYRGEVGAPHELLSACTRCSSWSTVEVVHSQDDGYLYPVKELLAAARDGDCSYEDARTFIQVLTGMDAFQRDCFGNFGALLRAASNYGETEHMDVLDTREPVKFSQRGLNTVIIAIWCVAGSASMLEVMQRVVYVGGDADTIGAVAGQLAGPLMPWEDVCRSFRRFVARESMQEEENGQHRMLALASAKRFFCRSLHYVSYDWQGLLSHPPQSDPAYEGLTDKGGTCLLVPEAAQGLSGPRGCGGGKSRRSKK